MVRKITVILLFCMIELMAAPFATPPHKEGIAGRNYTLLDPKRYDVLEHGLTFGLQKYNFYWREAENGPAASETPMQCPAGYVLFPKTPALKAKFGFHRYHCYRVKFISDFEKSFAFNRRHGLQAAAVLWTAPVKYIEPGCEGFLFGPQHVHLTEGCYPTPDHYDDYEDWVRFTALHFGRDIDHYVAWNEADLLDWADSSSTQYPRSVMADNLDFHMKRSLGIYTELLKCTIRAVDDLDKTCSPDNTPCQNLVYISMTSSWGDEPSVRERPQGMRIAWGGKSVVEAVWRDVGLKQPWAIAIHPYGEVHKKAKKMHIGTLAPLIEYQRAQIAARSNKPESEFAQSRLYLSEQNVNQASWEAKARFICEAHDVTMTTPQIIAVTHNHFQDPYTQKHLPTTLHAMLPTSVLPDLSNADDYLTFRAYTSTADGVWEKRNDHFCCEAYALGCQNASAPLLQKSNRLDGLLFPDADGNILSVSPATRWVVLAYDNDNGQALNAFFESHPTLLQSERVRYVADISQAPFLVRKMFILPALRDLPFPVMVIEDDEVSPRFRYNTMKSGIVLLKLNHFRIEAIRTLEPNDLSSIEEVLKK